MQGVNTDWLHAGPSAGHDGLNLRSYRCEDGLEAKLSIPEKFCSFPGIVSGGIISTLLDCHGNWTAAVSLMDEACLPKPPLTMTWNMNTTYKHPTPPDTPLLLRAKVRFEA
jgi:acyl-coenzyme A thioesterase PaaI-like protein